MSEDMAASAKMLMQPKTILIVEDSVYLRFTSAEYLRALNYVVYEAATADEAVQVLALPVVIDLVITDVEMPGTMNGLDLAKHIQKTLPAMDVIVVSGTPSKRIEETGLAFFKKPYDLHALSSHVEKVLPTKSIESENE